MLRGKLQAPSLSTLYHHSSHRDPQKWAQLEGKEVTAQKNGDWQQGHKD